jgi:hypothetical protein
MKIFWSWFVSFSTVVLYFSLSNSFPHEKWNLMLGSFIILGLGALISGGEKC